MKKIAALTVCAMLLTQGGVFAHEGETHAKGNKEDTRMEKLHMIMPMYMQIRAKIDEALINGDAKAIETETGKILETTADLKKAKPHKNLKQIETFRKMAAAFEGDVRKTATLAKTGDLAGAKNAFQSAKKRCDECHNKFRD